MSGRTLWNRFLGLALVFSFPTFAMAGISVVDFTDSYLSVQAQSVDVNELFQNIESTTGVTILITSPIDARISIDFRRTGFTRGMSLILSQLGADKYAGDFELGKTFEESTYTVRRISERELSEKRDAAVSLNAEGERLLAEGKDYQAYHVLIGALRADATFLPAHKNLVTIARLWGDYGRLSQRLEKMVKLDPGDADNYRLLADAYRRDYRPDKAIESYQRFVALSPTGRAAERSRAIITQMGTDKDAGLYRMISEARDLIAAGDVAQARSTLSRAAGAFPSDPKAHEMLAALDEGEGDYVTAARSRTRLETLDPADAKNLLLLGRDYRLLSQYDAAVDQLAKAKTQSRSEYMATLIEEEVARVREGAGRGGDE